MKQSLLIAVLVLVPFCALVALGFALLKDPPPVELPVVEAPVPPPRPLPPAAAPVALAGPVRHALDVSVPVVVPPEPVPQKPVPPPVPPPDLSEEAKRLPIVAAVEPLVNQCFKDFSDRVHEPMRVIVQFDTTPTGGFSGVVVKKASWPDPQFAACVIDAFEDAHFEPTGFALRRQSRTFTFGYPDGGR